MAEGNKAYDEGEFAKALKSMQDALKETLPPLRVLKAQDLRILLLPRNRMPQLPRQNSKILQADPKFDLEPAEAGHPWGPSFRAAKSKVKGSSRQMIETLGRYKILGTIGQGHGHRVQGG